MPKREWIVMLAVVLFSGSAMAQSIGTMFELQRDSRNKFIGRAYPVPSQNGLNPSLVTFWHRPTRSSYYAYFTRDYIFADAGDVLFTEPDCTGVPVIIWNAYDANTSQYKPAAIGPRRSLWIPRPNAPNNGIPGWPQSKWSPHLSNGKGACENLDWIEPDDPHTPIIPLLRATVLDDAFRPPYRTEGH